MKPSEHNDNPDHMLARQRKRRLVQAFLGCLILSFTILALAPGPAFCAVAPILPLETLPDGTRHDGSFSQQDLARMTALHKDAIERIGSVFGKPESKPIIIHLADPDAYWPMPFNSYAVTTYFAGRSCIVTGPEGRNVDVLAHEIVHAEIYTRTGIWQHMTQIPTWFDEGAAMQVDYRGGFDLEMGTPLAATTQVRSKTTSREFFAVKPETLNQHFVFAKAQVGDWLQRTGRNRFYHRLAELRSGKPFEKVWSE